MTGQRLNSVEGARKPRFDAERGKTPETRVRSSVFALQRRIGNSATHRFLTSQTPAAPVAPVTDSRFDRVEDRGAGSVSTTIDRVLSSPGKSLDRDTVAAMGLRLGHDFSHVRVHADDEAALSAHSLDAHAYTVGSHIVFSANAFAPGSRAGAQLLTHELVHVVQQSRAAADARRQLKVVDPSDSAEREAQNIALRVAETPASDRKRRPSVEPHRRFADGILRLQRAAGPISKLKLGDVELRRPPILGPKPLTLDPDLKWFPDLAKEIEAEKKKQVEADFPYIKAISARMKTPDDYSSQVKATFGSFNAYLEFAPVSDAELETVVGPHGKKLRSLIDQGDRGTRTQNVFYRWVRWEYVQRGLDPLTVVLTGMTPEMRRRIDAAGKALGVSIKAGGFNPRPMKDAKKLLILGTLSEHATGNAVDIDDHHNLIVSPAAWTFIEKATGSHTIDHSRKRWETDPGGLYDDIAKLSAAWQKRAAEMVQAEDDRRKLVARLAEHYSGSLLPGSLRAPTIPAEVQRRIPPPPLTRPRLLGPPEDTSPRGVRRAAAEHRQLILDALKTVPTMTEEDKLQSLNGLMTHRRDLVLELRKQGLLWGATFSNRDLHHFEIPETALPKWPPAPAPALAAP
jgi:Domain of unknown function (DUF4157)